MIKKSLLLFFCVLITFKLSGQENAETASPYDAVYTHLYYLQDDSYDPERAAIPFQLADTSQQEALAIKLKQILDARGLYVYLSKVTDNADHVDSLSGKAVFTIFPKKLPSVYLSKEGDRWLYSEETVRAIPELHKSVFPFGTDKLVNMVPRSSQRKILGVSIWQYLGLIIMLISAVVIYYFFKMILGFIFDRSIWKYLKISEDNHDNLRYVSNTLGLYLMVAILQYLLPTIQLPVQISSFVMKSLDLMQTIFLILIALKCIDLVIAYLFKLTAKTESKLDDQLIPIIRKGLKIIIVIIGAIHILQMLQVNITALIAGVSIGGLAIALAAQDTVKNFLGSVMIFLDQPFQIGEYIVAGNIEGTVEEVGVRSTRIRKIDTSVTAVPNGTLANLSLTNLGIRKFRIFQSKLTIMYNTPPEKIQAFIEALKKMVSGYESINQDNYLIFLNGLSDSSIDILFRVYIAVPDYRTELETKQSIIMDILKVAAENDVSFAFPSTSVYVEQMAKNT